MQRLDWLAICMILFIVSSLVGGHIYDYYHQKGYETGYDDGRIDGRRSVLESVESGDNWELIRCRSYMDCYDNPELEGCSYDGCNICCDGMCTLMACIDFDDVEEDYEFVNLTDITDPDKKLLAELIIEMRNNLLEGIEGWKHG